MTVQKLLDDLRQANIRLWVADGELRYRAPAGGMSAERLAALRRYRGDLIAMLPDRAVLEAVAPDAPTPLSIAQEFILHSVDADYLPHPGRTTCFSLDRFTTGGAFTVRGDLDLAVLEQASKDLLARHEMLRCRLIVVNNALMQHIAPMSQLPVVTTTDLTGLAPAERERLTRHVAERQIRYRFHFDCEDLLRVHAIRIAPDVHVVTVVTHHIAADMWSLTIMFGELAALYKARRSTQPAALAPVASRYIDFARMERMRLDATALRRHEQYWVQQLDGSPEATCLQPDHPKVSLLSGRQGSLRFSIATEIMRPLSVRAKSAGVSTFVTLYAAISLLIYASTGQTDQVVATPLALREDHRLLNVVGTFAKIVFLRCVIDPDAALSGWLRSLSATAAEAFEHTDITVGQIYRGVMSASGGTRRGITQTTFSLATALASPPTLSLGEDLTIEWFPVEQQATGHFRFYFFEQNGALLAHWQYLAELFEPETVQRAADLYVAILTCMSGDESMTIREVLDAAQKAAGP